MNSNAGTGTEGPAIGRGRNTLRRGGIYVAGPNPSQSSAQSSKTINSSSPPEKNPPPPPLRRTHAKTNPEKAKFVSFPSPGSPSSPSNSATQSPLSLQNRVRSPTVTNAPSSTFGASASRFATVGSKSNLFAEASNNSANTNNSSTSPTRPSITSFSYLPTPAKDSGTSGRKTPPGPPLSSSPGSSGAPPPRPKRPEQFQGVTKAATFDVPPSTVLREAVEAPRLSLSSTTTGPKSASPGPKSVNTVASSSFFAPMKSFSEPSSVELGRKQATSLAEKADYKPGEKTNPEKVNGIHGIHPTTSDPPKLSRDTRSFSAVGISDTRSKEGMWKSTVGKISLTMRKKKKTFKVPSSTTPTRVVANDNFVSQDPDELSFQKGDFILVKEMDSSPAPWCRGTRIRDGKEGWFPLSLVDAEDPNATLRPKKDRPVERRSIILNKTETQEILEKHLSFRPSKKELQDNHILALTEASPVLIATQSNLEKKKKLDFLTSFFKKKKTSTQEAVPAVEIVGKSEVTFGDKLLTTEDKVTDQFSIKNAGTSILKWGLQVEDFSQPFTMTFSPSSGHLAKGKKQTIQVTLQLKTLVTLDSPIHVVTKEGKRLVTVNAKIRCKRTAFGVDPTTLDQVDDQGIRVPLILAKLKDSLVKFDGFNKEGLFRVSGNQTEILKLRKEIDANDFEESSDSHTVASLMKVWFRELPQPLLQNLTKDQLSTDSPATCVEIVENSVPPVQLNLFRWLVRLLQHVMTFKENKMGPENLAIVVGPNMLRLPKEMDSIEGLVISQRLTKFCQHILSTMKVPGNVTLTDAKAKPGPKVAESAPKPVPKGPETKPISADTKPIPSPSDSKSAENRPHEHPKPTPSKFLGSKPPLPAYPPPTRGLSSKTSDASRSHPIAPRSLPEVGRANPGPLTDSEEDSQLLSVLSNKRTLPRAPRHRRSNSLTSFQQLEVAMGYVSKPTPPAAPPRPVGPKPAVLPKKSGAISPRGNVLASPFEV
eukprot:TRINITY_DN2873_c0_g1_i1.p1 TRINITY_DN2873_c0_g1~~TRINITY_DN2873_c0_g1_i1.p1  ORF type:complete len:990 (+),score=226.22 TRINITY_DN2873_c0_g1_i1:272-3241(+)